MTVSSARRSSCGSGRIPPRETYGSAEYATVARGSATSDPARQGAWEDMDALRSDRSMISMTVSSDRRSSCGSGRVPQRDTCDSPANANDDRDPRASDTLGPSEDVDDHQSKNCMLLDQCLPPEHTNGRCGSIAAGAWKNADQHRWQ